MSIPSLAKLSGRKIPMEVLFFAAEHEGNVINQEFIDSVHVHRDFQQRDLRSMCQVCNQNGDCLCYLFQIRHMMIECYWGTEADYRSLGDWLAPFN